jgi:type I restriction enzyme S subunit
MAGEWTISTVGEVSKRVTKGTTPTTIGGRFAETGVAFVKVESITDDGRFDWEKLAFVDEETNQLLARSMLEEDDVLFSIAGTIGRVARVPRELLPANTNQAVAIVRPDRDVIDPRFLYYVLRDDVRVKHAHTRVVQSVQANFSLAELSSIEVPLPPKAEQRAIAHILGTLDDKIELNRRMSETLEAMARALFKAWFVDFEPVRAKMEGRWRRGESLPGLPAHLYDLFPDRLVDSELGEIPEGWGVATLPELIDVNPSHPLRKGQIAPYLDMANMPTRGHAPDEVVERPFGSGMRFINGDTLVARITPCLENGKTAFVDFLQQGQVGWGSTEYIVLRPKPPLPEPFAYCLARSDDFREFAIQSMTGTSGRQRVQADSLTHFRLARVPQLVAEAFGRAIKPLFVRSSAAIRESRTLATLRDTLLPKLISGELRVKNAEKTLEECQ